MDKNEDQVQTISSKTLLIRHLPAELSQDEKEDLLKYFGAETVRVFSNRGRLVGCASETSPLEMHTSCCPVWTGFFYLHRNMQPLQPSGVRSQQQEWVTDVVFVIVRNMSRHDLCEVANFVS